MDEQDLVAVQIHDDGNVRTVHGEVTWKSAEHRRIISLNIVREMLMQSLFLAADLGNKASYYGLWDTGVHITHTQGAADTGLAIRGGVRGADWNEPTYEQVTTITSEHLSKEPADVVYRLLLGLARVLRVEQELAKRLTMDSAP